MVFTNAYPSSRHLHSRLSRQTLTLVSLIAVYCSTTVLADATYSSSLYSNDFIDPNYVLNKNWNTSTLAAQQSIVDWAELLAEQGPWSVVNKVIAPASGDMHDYLSWAPYWWPNCSNVGNTSALTQEQVWTECIYVNHDGEFNPDLDLVENNDDFTSMSDAAIYGALAWQFTSNQTYADNVARFISAWFLDEDTYMNPNMNYGQVVRGPNSTLGDHTGILDLRAMTRVTSAILILRGGNSTSWTSDLDTRMNNWTTTYLDWLASSELGIEEINAGNNHETFCVNQVSSMQILVGDTDGAKQTLSSFFNGAYLYQISADGEQPLEAVRTHPYHYRAYNLQALVTNARIGDYLGVDYWSHPTANGSNIQTALNYASTFTVTIAGDGPEDELFTSMAAVAAGYGDLNDQYAKYIAARDATYPSSPYFFWCQYMTDLSLPAATPTSTDSSASSTSTSDTSGSPHRMGISCLSILAAFIVGSTFFRELNDFVL